MRRKSSWVRSRAHWDRVVCVGGGLYQWAHRRTWPRAGVRAVLAKVRQNWILERSYLASNGTLVGRLALDGEGNTVGGLGLDLKVGCKLISFQCHCAWGYASRAYPGWRGRSPCSGAMDLSISCGIEREMPAIFIRHWPPWRCQRKQQEQTWWID